MIILASIRSLLDELLVRLRLKNRPPCDCGRGCPTYEYPPGRLGYDPLFGQCEKEYLASLREQAKALGRPAPGIPKGNPEGFPRVLCDQVIERWLTADEMGEAFEVPAEETREWEGKGLPALGEGTDRRFPLPQAGAWVTCFRTLTERGHDIDHLPADIAIRFHHAQTAFLSWGEYLRPNKLGDLLDPSGLPGGELADESTEQLGAILAMCALEDHSKIQRAREGLEQACTEADLRKAQERLTEVEARVRAEVRETLDREYFNSVLQLEFALANAKAATRLGDRIEDQRGRLLGENAAAEGVPLEASPCGE